MRLSLPAFLGLALLAAPPAAFAQATGATTAVPGAAGGGAITALSAGQLRAKDLMDRDVHGSDDREVGEIDDLVIDPATGRIVAVVVEVEGTLGIGGRHVAIPLERLRFGEDRRIGLGMTRDEFRALPDFNPRN